MNRNWQEEYDDPDFYWGEEPTDFLCHITGLCGCGSGKDFEVIEEVFRFCALTEEEGKYDKEKQSQGCYRSVEWELAAKVLDAAGLVEHGTGIGWPWLTASGKRALQILDSLKQEPGKGE